MNLLQRLFGKKKVEQPLKEFVAPKPLSFRERTEIELARTRQDNNTKRKHYEDHSRKDTSDSLVASLMFTPSNNDDSYTSSTDNSSSGFDGGFGGGGFSGSGSGGSWDSGSSGYDSGSSSYDSGSSDYGSSSSSDW